MILISESPINFDTKIRRNKKKGFQGINKKFGKVFEKFDENMAFCLVLLNFKILSSFNLFLLKIEL